MIKKIIQFYKVSSSSEVIGTSEEIKKRYTRLRWSVFLSATLGYSLYYVSRLSLNVLKKPLLDANIFSETELGMIGSALFFSYAIGKLFNGFLADRSNIARFMSTGLMFSALINLILGFSTSFMVFTILWGVNGWFQSMGAAPSVISLSRWFSNEERGTYYGIWSASHSLGKAITYIGVAFIVSVAGWQWGFWGAGLIGLLGALIIAIFLYDSPESEGLPAIADYKNDHSEVSSKKKSVTSLQKEALTNPYIWILAFASSAMYISRYAIESWGVFFLESQKNYSGIEASSIISIGAISGIVGTIVSGIISDKFFKGSRNVPALFAGLLNVFSLSLFLFYPKGHIWMDSLSMVLSGFAIGILITFVGGLMAVDIAPKKVSGTVLGLVGVASYIGAGMQDIISGKLIENGKTTVNNIIAYDFSVVKYFWLGAAIISVILTLLVWNAKARD
jgi:OPA family sugar phosphate sensor protein UhpC-like MFS transporter